MLYNIGPEQIKIIEALENILKNETDYNVIIYVGEEPDFEEFHAHSNILRSRSDCFNEIFSSEDIKKEDGKFIINKPNITPRSFSFILNYLYTGRINANDKTGIELLNIMIASDELKLNKLIEFAENSIITGNRQFLWDDPVRTLQIINSHKIFATLQEFYFATICSEPKILFNSDKFIQLSASMLETILNRDDLKLDEIEIWENLIKWGLAQDQTLNQEISNWNQEDFTIFKRILHNLAPLVRFYGISSKDYILKVKPYEDILPKELKDDLFKYYMIPEYKPTLNNLTPRYSKIIIDSVIINQQHIVLFANWIDQKVKNSRYIKTIPYEFNLIYRASRDGWTSAAFHKECDSKKSNIVVAKIRQSEQIVGGYNPHIWDKSNTFKSVKGSFIFSFTNRMDLSSAKVGYSNGDAHSIGCYSNNGPLFGGSGGNDLVCCDNGNWKSKNPYSYPRIDVPTSFRVDDYEVFQVINKKANDTDKNLGNEVIEKEEKKPEIVEVDVKDDTGSVKKKSIVSMFKGKK